VNPAWVIAIACLALAVSLGAALFAAAALDATRKAGGLETRAFVERTLAEFHTGQKTQRRDFDDLAEETDRAVQAMRKDAKQAQAASARAAKSERAVGDVADLEAPQSRAELRAHLRSVGRL